jgi:hypothetical protein
VAEAREPVELVPAKLRSYDRQHWSQLGDGRWDAFNRWKAARRKWLEAHPGSQALGNGVEHMRAEYQAQHSPEHYPPNATSW